GVRGGLRSHRFVQDDRGLGGPRGFAFWAWAGRRSVPPKPSSVIEPPPISAGPLPPSEAISGVAWALATPTTHFRASGFSDCLPHSSRRACIAATLSGCAAATLFFS